MAAQAGCHPAGAASPSARACSARTGIAGSVESYLQLLNWNKEIRLWTELGSLSHVGFSDVLSSLGEPLPPLVKNAEICRFRADALTGR